MAEHPLTPHHADLSRRAVVDTGALPWVQSPEPTVERKLIEREGGDGTRATSLVRFAPGASFPEHVHDGGEEFLVLEGAFCDETGCFPAGHYVRNPPGSRHRPSAPDGCVIQVVQLHQDHAAVDRKSVV